MGDPEERDTAVRGTLPGPMHDTHRCRALRGFSGADSQSSLRHLCLGRRTGALTKGVGVHDQRLDSHHQSSTLDDAYSELPVAIVDEWDERCLGDENLGAWIRELAPYYDE